MAVTWFVRGGGKVYGPLDAARLKRLADEGKIGQQTYVATSATGPWHPASKVRWLFPEAGAAASPPPLTLQVEKGGKFAINPPYAANEKASDRQMDGVMRLSDRAEWRGSLWNPFPVQRGPRGAVPVVCARLRVPSIARAHAAVVADLAKMGVCPKTNNRRQIIAYKGSWFLTGFGSGIFCPSALIHLRLKVFFGGKAEDNVAIVKIYGISPDYVWLNRGKYQKEGARWCERVLIAMRSS